MDVDPRDRDGDARDVEIPWVDVEGRRDDGGESIDSRSRDDDTRDRDRDPADRDPNDPRDVFVAGLELPRGPEREIVLEGDYRYELNGDDSRTLATIGAFRVVAEPDLRESPEESDRREPDLRHLRGEGLVQVVSLDGRERVLTLTERGRHLLEAHRRDRDDDGRQAFQAGVSRARELSHDSQLYRAYVREHERLREQGADIRRVVLDGDLKREYQEWLQAPNRGRPDSDGRPDREPREIEQWAHEHDLPYFDGHVHFPDFRIEYELEGRDRHEDVEVVTEHYRGAHAAGVAQSGFRCYGRGGGGRSGGRGFDPGVAEDFL
jgi:hypothetical protein